MASSFSSYLKRSVPYLFLGGGAVTGMALMYPHTVGLESYKSLLAIHTADGNEEEVDIEIEKIAEEIADKLEWTKEQKVRTKLFPGIWIDFVHTGNCSSRWGAAVGVPGYMISSLNVVEKMTLSGKLGNFNVDWALPPGQNLLKSLEMLTKAKTFSLAKEMCEVESNPSSWMAGLTAATIPGAYFLTKLFQTISGFHRHRVLIAASYGLVFPTVFVSYVSLKDSYNCKRQEGIDDRLLSLGGTDMARNGADYYSALLMRNQALLSLCGKSGAPSHITYYGNNKSVWRKSEPLLTERRDKMIKYLEMHGADT